MSDTQQSMKAPDAKAPARSAGVSLVQRINSPEFKQKLLGVQGKFLSAERMMRILSSAMSRTPKLLECSYTSILNAVVGAVKLGVEVDGRHAHLVPYKGEAVLIVDWKGYVLIGRRNGVTGINTQAVYSNDEFTIEHSEAGTKLKHVPLLNGDRGEPIGCYCAYTIDGVASVEWMSVHEIELVRARSKAADDGPWVTDWIEMGRKTVTRRASKYWPFSDVEVEGLAADDGLGAAIDVETTVTTSGQVGEAITSAATKAETTAPVTQALPEAGSGPQMPTKTRRIRAESVVAAAPDPAPAPKAAPAPAPTRQAAPAAPEPAAERAPAPNPEPSVEPVSDPNAPQLGPWAAGLLADLTECGHTFQDLVDVQGDGKVIPGINIGHLPDIYDLSETVASKLIQARTKLMRAINEHKRGTAGA